MPMTPDFPADQSMLDQLCIETSRQIQERGMEKVVVALLQQFGFEGRQIAFEKLTQASPKWRGKEE